MKKLFFISILGASAVLTNAETLNFKPCITATINNKSKIQWDKLESIGRPYKEYSRGILKFDLKNVPYMKYSKVRQAYLSMEVADYKNPDLLFTQLHVINYPWTRENLSWSGKPWPKPKGISRGYIDLSTSFIPSREFIGKTRKVFKYEVTDIINQWLYEGIPNYGFMLKTGPDYLGGKHNKGAWEISFKNPALEIEFDTAPIPAPTTQRERTLRYFPAASLPPIAKPYHFLWCCWSGRGTYFWDKFEYMNIEGTWQKEALLQRGVLSLWGRGGAQWKWLKTKEIVEKAYNNPVGIAIDEWQSGKVFRSESTRPGSSPDMQRRVQAIVDGIKAVHKTNPSEFICVYWRGEESLKQLGKIPDLIVCEAYTHTPKNRRWGFADFKDFFEKRHVGWAKKDGHYDRTIAMIGELCPKKYYQKYYPENPMTPEIMESQIKAVRELCPEMAGIGFYARMYNNKDPEEIKQLGELAATADKLCYKYFVKPAPEAAISNPAFEQEITSPHLRIKVDAKGKEGRRIKQYRYFIDNRLIAENNCPELVWDCRGVEPGRHTITVHAIDSAYNRTAAQIPVKIKVGGNGK